MKIAKKEWDMWKDRLRVENLAKKKEKEEKIKNMEKAKRFERKKESEIL